MSLETGEVVAQLVTAHQEGRVEPQLTIEVAHELCACLRHELSTHDRWLVSHSVDSVILDPQLTRASEVQLELHGEARFTPQGQAPVQAMITLFSDNTPLSVSVKFGNEDNPWRPELLGFDSDHPIAQSDVFTRDHLWISRWFYHGTKHSARDVRRDQRAMHLIQSIEQGYRPSQLSEWLTREGIHGIELIGILRTTTGCSLREAKPLSEAWLSADASDSEELDRKILELFRARPPLLKTR